MRGTLGHQFILPKQHDALNPDASRVLKGLPKTLKAEKIYPSSGKNFQEFLGPRSMAAAAAAAASHPTLKSEFL